MNNLKLFRLESSTASEILGYSSALERPLQKLIENNLNALLGVRLVASEFSTGREHGGRIDTLGLDENGCPVIVEYKRESDKNVINQGLFYLDWLVTHHGDFEMKVLEAIGEKEAKSVEWSGPRLICIAGEFNRYDEYAIKQMNHDIDLIQYAKFGNDLLALEKIGAASSQEGRKSIGSTKRVPRKGTSTVSDILGGVDADLGDRYEALRAHLVSLGDDVQVTALKGYVAFKRIKNFVCVQIHTQERKLQTFVKIDPDSIELEKGFTRDVRNVGHWGTGDLEITMKTAADFDRAKPLFKRSYENS